MKFSVFSWNISGRKHYTNTPFPKVVSTLQNVSNDILCLQEVPGARDKLSPLDLSQYEILIPTGNNNFYTNFNHNVILSKFPIKKSGEIDFLNMLKGQEFERILWADIAVHNLMVRVYNCHLKILGVGIAERMQQFDSILEHASTCTHPVIICGDLNTTIPHHGWARRIVRWFHKQPEKSMYIDDEYISEDERFLCLRKAEEHGFSEASDINTPTWRLFFTKWELFDLKLDWFLTRGMHSELIEFGEYISDHRSFDVKCSCK